MAEIVMRARDVFHDEGLVSLLYSSKEYISDRLEDHWLKYRYRLEYGEIAPRPDERLWIDPRNISYGIYSGYLYREGRTYPNYGILDGSWDQRKKPYAESSVWGGLRERFENGTPWEETAYYRTGMEQLESGDSVGYLDGPQTVEHFERYLDELDELYEDIRDNGYDPSSVITVHVGRDGEWMVGHGNHRRTIASVVGVDSIPVRVKYRHEKWQDRRRRFYEADSIEEIDDSREYLSHPDIPAVTSSNVG